MPDSFEEIRVISQPKAWAILIVLSAAIIAWGLWVYSIIPNTPRVHNYGALNDAPGQSIYSTDATPGGGTEVPAQIQLPPEAKPLNSTPPPATTAPGGQP